MHSNGLYVRHLSAKMDVRERTDFLKYFGAQTVRFVNERSHAAFAHFESREAAEIAMRRLHQMEVMGRRLVVEYADDRNRQLAKNQSATLSGVEESCDSLKAFVRRLNALPALPPDLRYKYPPAEPHALFNIIYTLAHDLRFYTQTLHLMNKMGLEPPFGEMRAPAVAFLRECLKNVRLSLAEDSPETGSEMSFEEDETTKPSETIPVKRKSKLKYDMKRKLKANPKGSVVRKPPIDPGSVFEDNISDVKKKRKKIEINVETSSAPQPIESNIEIVGSIGKIDPPSSSEQNIVPEEHKPEVIETTFTSEEILANRLSADDMKSLPVFKNYDPGAPSMRLYIKNLAKGVTTQEITNLYNRYVPECASEDEKKMFDVRVMQEGRMKGQAFVTLPSVEASRRALEETNGFVLKDKPMVVHFARTANK